VAVDLLANPAFDALVTGESTFEDLPLVLPRLADGELFALCQRISYGPADDGPPPGNRVAEDSPCSA
jgi:hypothetical protein